MENIKFGTDGWRAIIAKEYTENNVARVSKAVADFANKKYPNPTIVIGYDCRFGGKMFAETAAKVFTHEGVKVILSNSFVSTPMVSLAVIQYKANLGIVITASHNPPEYNGYKLKGDFGGPLLQNDISEVESMIPETNKINLKEISIDELKKENKISYENFENLYCDHVSKNFDLDSINNSSMQIAYDPMFGAGLNTVKKLLKNITQINDDLNPGFKGISPEPIERNLKKLSKLIKENSLKIDCGLATDGDADRIGLYNHLGEFIDSHHIIVLLIHYLAKYKKLSGKVVTAFSCSVKVSQICKHYNLDHEVVKIGFKHIADKMIKEDVLLGGEESGGIATKGHIPERDGIWMGLILLEFMAKSKKSLNELINEVYDIIGEFAFERMDLHISSKLKENILKKCTNNEYNIFGKHSIIKTENLDGFKYYFDENTWLMIRPSGTEPVLRVYCEAKNKNECIEILNSTKKVLLQNE
ncbi:MAG: phosphoglucosamine mutase [Flavobacteriales bacterium]|nr:phosphoglucosamine mutase [Flavobacteriales bacterium]